ncbi:hypothetical protein, partial [Corynebacterium variabile]|uniref:hypothetical protein n=1 Tax=Corynebacterium variabile TaxID=1727 RepID=UPI0028987CD7
ATKNLIHHAIEFSNNIRTQRITHPCSGEIRSGCDRNCTTSGMQAQTQDVRQVNDLLPDVSYISQRRCPPLQSVTLSGV